MRILMERAMLHSIKITAMAALGLLGAISVAAAEPARIDDLSGRIFGAQSSARKQSACFVRTYDSAHLAAHPKQKVRQMMLLVGREADEDTDAAEGSSHFSFSVGFRMRGESGRLESSGSCSRAKAAETGENMARINCGVDCDGGGLALQISDDNKSLRVEMDEIRVEVAGAKPKDDDEPDGHRLSGGADDRVFRLDRANLRECLPLVTDKAEIAAIKRGK